jgi:D-lactate dehydrogenase (cytochrome)
VTPLPASTKQLIDELDRIVGPKGLTRDAVALGPQLRDWVGYAEGATPVMVMPASTEEMADVVRACARHGAPIVPQGGNTSSVAGGIPHGEVLVSLRRMNRIRNIDAADYTITADAGCVLAAVQKAALEADRFFPLSIGSEGSCTVGGNVSTNAGGIAVLRYGNMRDLVLGLEVVLADGTVWDGLRRLRKDNAGYALKHMFMGAEGTLGIVTGVVLRLYPRPREVATGFVALRDLDACLELLAMLREASGDALSSFELIPRAGLDIALRYDPGVADPLTSRHDWHALVEVSGTRADGSTRAALEAGLATALEFGVARDAVLASSLAQADGLWRIRRAIVEFQPHAGGEIKHDVSVPISLVPQFIREANEAVEGVLAGIRPVAYGHVGDGNIHYNLSPPDAVSREAFLGRAEDLHRAVYDVAVRLGGSFAAEHGIGTVKRRELARYRSGVELAMMRRLKNMLDPQGLMNPGKVLVAE